MGKIIFEIKEDEVDRGYSAGAIEYGIHTAFVDASDPADVRYADELPLTQRTTADLWRDIQVYANHTFHRRRRRRGAQRRQESNRDRALRHGAG